MAGMDVAAAAIALVATFLQTYTSLKEFGRARRPEVDWMNSEDELIDQIPPWRAVERRRSRRTLVSMRPDDIDKEIRHIKRVLAGWTLLDVAVCFALADAVMN